MIVTSLSPATAFSVAPTAVTDVVLAVVTDVVLAAVTVTGAPFPEDCTVKFVRPVQPVNVPTKPAPVVLTVVVSMFLTVRPPGSAAVVISAVNVSLAPAPPSRLSKADSESAVPKLNTSLAAPPTKVFAPIVSEPVNASGILIVFNELR